MDKAATVFNKVAYSGNLDMALSQMDKVKDYANLVHGELLERHAEGHILIPAWVASKVTKAEDYLNSVYDYMSAGNYKYAYAKDKFTPHMMYHGKKSKMANTYEEHLALKNKGWGHTKTAGKTKAVQSVLDIPLKANYNRAAIDGLATAGIITAPIGVAAGIYNKSKGKTFFGNEKKEKSKTASIDKANHLFFKVANQAKVQQLMAKGMTKAQAMKMAYPQGQPGAAIGSHAAAPPMPVAL